MNVQPVMSPACLTFFKAWTASLAAAAVPHADGWRHWVSDKVLWCGIAAVALLVLSLLLRGMLKVITLAFVVVLAAGAFYFFRDTWEHRSELLPREWVALAERTLALLESVGARGSEVLAAGASDGSWSSSLGVPTVDGLGPIGGGDHSPDEWIDATSVAPRIEVVRRLCQQT